MTAPPPSRRHPVPCDGRSVRRIASRYAPANDWDGPAFTPKQETKIDMGEVCMAAGISLCVGAAIILAGIAGLLSIGWRP